VKAELIAVGSEMVRSPRRDSNSAWLMQQLDRIGFEVLARCVIEDNVSEIAGQLKVALERAELVIVTGGIGPTGDDRTRQSAADALGLPLERDPKQVKQLKAMFDARGWRFRPMQESQADKPLGSTWLHNELGTAPGFWIEQGAAQLVVLPGVPCEMQWIFTHLVLPRLENSDTGGLANCRLKVAGLSEPAVEHLITDLYTVDGLDLVILAGSSGIELQLRTVAGTRPEALDSLERVATDLANRLGDNLYGREDETLQQAVGSLLHQEQRTVATAESCTAGMLAAAITSVPGSSGWYRGGMVVYTDELKIALARVNRDTISRYGAVSQQVAIELAQGARMRCGADYGVGITGIAGPGGGTPAKPVGLVHVALADARETHHRPFEFRGDRDQIRRRTVTTALDMLRRQLLATTTD
jgi:nicotinamide-nucleotide amidase